MTTLKSLSFAALAGLASGNFVSPGLKKCLTTMDDNVVLTACTTDENQDFAVPADGTIFSSSSKMCLQADAAVANSEVHLTADCTGPLTRWELTQNGYVKIEGSDQCLDVIAEEKADGTRETWDEIILHESVRIQLYDCHDVCTSRVNQLWSWAAITGDDFGAADAQNTQLGPVAGNLVSPGLAKCLDVGGIVEGDLAADNNNIQLTTCSDGFNLNFLIINGVIKAPEMGKCLIPESAVKNSNVVLGECGNDVRWSLTEFGYVKLEGTDLCMDVNALMKDDGTYENWEEIKTHETANVILYTCHSSDTKRVNQLWEWSPIQPDSMGSRAECDSTPTPIDDTNPTPVDDARDTIPPPQNSMPGSVDEANELATGELAGTLDEYAIGQVHMSSAAAFASVASAAVLGAVAATAFAHRRGVSVAESESLLVAEE